MVGVRHARLLCIANTDLVVISMVTVGQRCLVLVLIIYDGNAVGVPLSRSCSGCLFTVLSPSVQLYWNDTSKAS